MKFSDKFGGYKVCLDLHKVEEAIERMFDVYCKMSAALQVGDEKSYQVFEAQYGNMELMFELMGFDCDSEGFGMNDDGTFDIYAVAAYTGPYDNRCYGLEVRFEPMPLSYTGTYAQRYTVRSEWFVSNEADYGWCGGRIRHWEVTDHGYYPPHATPAERDERVEKCRIKYTCGHEKEVEMKGTWQQRKLECIRLRQCKCPACTEADENRFIAEHEVEADKKKLPKFVGEHIPVVEAYKRRDEFIKLMPDYASDSEWRQPVIKWNGTPLTREEVYKRIISGVTDPEWWERWVYHGGGMTDTTQAYEEALDQYDSRFEKDKN